MHQGQEMPQPAAVDEAAAALSSIESTLSQDQNERETLAEDADDDTLPSSDDKKRKKKEWKVMLTADLALEIYKLRPPLDQVGLPLRWLLNAFFLRHNPGSHCLV
jgi:hypothetical protein